MPLAGCADAGACLTTLYSGVVSDMAVSDKLRVVAATDLGNGAATYSYCVTPLQGASSCSYTFQRLKALDGARAVVRADDGFTVFSFGRNIYLLAD
jgi:hypothetical protein